VVLSAAILIGSAPSKAQAAKFLGLGNFGAPFDSLAYGVSGNGSLVVGYSATASGNLAFVWTHSSGVAGLAICPAKIRQRRLRRRGQRFGFRGAFQFRFRRRSVPHQR